MEGRKVIRKIVKIGDARYLAIGELLPDWKQGYVELAIACYATNEVLLKVTKIEVVDEPQATNID